MNNERSKVERLLYCIKTQFFSLFLALFLGVEKYALHSDSFDDLLGNRIQFLMQSRNSRHTEEPLRSK